MNQAGSIQRFARAVACRLLPLYFCSGVLFGATGNLNYSSLGLKDGRTLANAQIHSYQWNNGRVVLSSGKTMMSVPISLLDPSIANQVRLHFPNRHYYSPIADPLGYSGGPSQASQRNTQPMPPRNEHGVPSVEEHRRRAMDRAQNYFQYEYQTINNSISVRSCHFDLGMTTKVEGWGERYRTAGRAYMEIYVSRGNSYNRTTQEFEILTEYNAGQDLRVVDLTLK